VLRRLLLHVIEHPEVAPRLSTAPAAVANHHAYRSGLAEHTLSMMRLATLIGSHYADYYPGRIEPDLLVAGVLLHDLGKVWELEGDLATRYSTVGNLVGHIPMGAAFIARAAAELGDVPDALVHELQHLVLSHHGELAYGSPQTPKTLEAQLLHYIDQLDSKANLFVNAAGTTPGWSPFQRNLGRPVLQPSELRTSWAAPASGALGDRGPGRPVDGTNDSSRVATVKPSGRAARVRPAADPPIEAEPTTEEPATLRERNPVAASSALEQAPTATLREVIAPPSRGDHEPPPPTDDDAPGNLDLFDGLG
jgi:3'-5' exoribonuclease